MRDTAWLSETAAPSQPNSSTPASPPAPSIFILAGENRANINSTSAQNAARASAISGPPLNALAAVMPELPITQRCLHRDRTQSPPGSSPAQPIPCRAGTRAARAHPHRLARPQPVRKSTPPTSSASSDSVAACSSTESRSKSLSSQIKPRACCRQPARNPVLVPSACTTAKLLSRRHQATRNSPLALSSGNAKFHSPARDVPIRRHHLPLQLVRARREHRPPSPPASSAQPCASTASVCALPSGPTRCSDECSTSMREL